MPWFQALVARKRIRGDLPDAEKSLQELKSRCCGTLRENIFAVKIMFDNVHRMVELVDGLADWSQMLTRHLIQQPT